MYHDPFGIYLIKSAGPLEDLSSAAKAGSPEIKAEVSAVQEASASSGKPISRSKAALLVALGISAGIGGTLLYQGMRGKQ